MKLQLKKEPHFTKYSSFIW